MAQVRGEAAASSRCSSRTWARRSRAPCRCGCSAAPQGADPVLRHRAADGRRALPGRHPDPQGARHPAHRRDGALRAAVPARGAAVAAASSSCAGRSPARTGQARRRARHRLLLALGVLAVIFLIKLPFGGFWRYYLRGHDRRPGHRLVLGQADLRAHREGPARPLGRTARRAAASAPRSPRRSRATRTRPRAERCARAWTSSPPSSSNVGLLRRPQGHTRHGHPLGQLAARRGAGPARSRARRSTRSAAGT